MFDAPERLLLGLVTGVHFGFLLQKGRVAKFPVIVGQFLLKDWTVVKVMGTAVVVGLVGVHALAASGQANLHVKPFLLGGVLVGGVCFGAAMAVFGYCPGTSVAACGEGKPDAMAGVLGMLAVALAFVAAFPALQPLIKGLGDLGKVTLPEATGTSPWLWVAALASACPVPVRSLQSARVEEVGRLANEEPPQGRGLFRRVSRRDRVPPGVRSRRLFFGPCGTDDRLRRRTTEMDTPERTMAERIAQAAIGFEQRRTGNHVPKSVTVVLSEGTLVITLHEALSPAKCCPRVRPVQPRCRSSTGNCSPTPPRPCARRSSGSRGWTRGAVVQAFTTGTVVQVFLLAGSAPTEVWSGSAPGGEA